jgi:hypothetical protein
MLFGKIWKNVNKEKLLQMICFKCWNILPRATHYGAILFTLSTIKSYSSCHIDMTVKGGCVMYLLGPIQYISHPEEK